jgi:hypothetical protein
MWGRYRTAQDVAVEAHVAGIKAGGEEGLNTHHGGSNFRRSNVAVWMDSGDGFHVL